MPQFSVLVLGHDNAWSIGDALRSVASQHFQDWECLVCDDGSTDGTSEVVKPFLADQRFRFHRHGANVGQAQNWAFAIRESRGRFLATLHADDLWCPGALSAYHRLLADGPDSAMAVAQWERVNRSLVRLKHQPPRKASGSLSGDDAFSWILIRNQLLPSAVCFTRSACELVGDPFPEYGMLCDRDYFLRIARSCGSVEVSNELVAQYRVHDDSVTSRFTRSGAFLNELIHFEQRLPSLLEGHPQAVALLDSYRRSSADFYFRSAVSLSVEGNRTSAVDLMAKALERDPGLRGKFRNAIKLMLFESGALGGGLLRLLHGKKLDAITTV